MHGIILWADNRSDSLQGEAQLKKSFHRFPYLFPTAVGSKKEKEKLKEGHYNFIIRTEGVKQSAHDKDLEIRMEQNNKLCKVFENTYSYN